MHNSGATQRKTYVAPARRAEATAKAEPTGEALERRRKREEFERERAESARTLAAARRNMFSHFKLWTVCPDRRCKRAQSCRGDVEQCLNQRWHPLVPQDLKTFVHKALGYQNDGHSPLEAVRLAQDDMTRHREAAARVDAKYPQGVRTPVPAQPAAPAPPPPPPAPPRVEPPWRGPRIRFP